MCPLYLSGTIQGQYNEIPTDTYVSHWTNEVLAIARGATQITITNHNVNNVKIGKLMKLLHLLF
jgi:hypothetical protein